MRWNGRLRGAAGNPELATYARSAVKAMQALPVVEDGAAERFGLTAPEDPGPRDKRFANPLWDTNPWFNLIKKQYLTNADAMKQAAMGDDVEVPLLEVGDLVLGFAYDDLDDRFGGHE